GRRLCPPARTLPSSPSSARSAVASSSVVGAEYSNGAGYTSHLPPVNPLRPPQPARLGDPSPSDHTARRFGASAAADFSIGFQEAVRTGAAERFGAAISTAGTSAFPSTRRGAGATRPGPPTAPPRRG